MIQPPPRKFHVDVAAADGGTRRMCVHDWGDIANQNVLVCVHGLSRNGRDFDVIAHALSDRYRVLCPDVIGRGESDWYAAAAEYAIPNYCSAMLKMLADQAIKQYDWIGTSMGGLIGMVIAAMRDCGMRRFVINDVGPEIERGAIERIAGYMGGRSPSFPDYMALFNAAQPAIAPFGPLTDEQKHHIIATSSRRRDDGSWEFSHDPKIGQAFVAALAAKPTDLWPVWESVRARTFVLRGEASDLLSISTFNRMIRTPIGTMGLTLSATGHAPMLMDAQTIAQVRAFLLSA